MSCHIGYLKLEESYLSHEKLSFRLILEESNENENEERHRAIKSKCVENCPQQNMNFTIVENRLAGSCM